MAGLALGVTGFSPPGTENLSSVSERAIKFITPVDGDMLHEFDGTISEGALVIKAIISAPRGSRIRVNGKKAKWDKGFYTTDILLKDYKNAITLYEIKSGYQENITVFQLKNYANRYRFSFDDNIWFLKDIAANAERYKSIFDNPYLGFLKKVHDTFGTKIHLNMYYQTEGFNLSGMTARFRNQWKENSEWLGLSFHALANEPDRPYMHAGYEQVKRDCNLVQEQIRRFAGEEVMGPETTLHWGESTVEGCRALRDSGYNILAGYFNVDDNKAPVSYYLTEEQRRHLKHRFIWRNNKEGIIFSRIALVVNSVKSGEIIPYLDNVKKTYNPRYIDLMIHEQYFYPHYVAYQPDWKEKVMTAAKWAADNGFNPGFLKECVFA